MIKYIIGFVILISFVPDTISQVTETATDQIASSSQDLSTNTITSRDASITITSPLIPTKESSPITELTTPTSSSETQKTSSSTNTSPKASSVVSSTAKSEGTTVTPDYVTTPSSRTELTTKSEGTTFTTNHVTTSNPHTISTSQNIPITTKSPPFPGWKIAVIVIAIVIFIIIIAIIIYCLMKKRSSFLSPYKTSYNSMTDNVSIDEEQGTSSNRRKK